MKRHFTLLCLLFVCIFTAVAQQGINYQAIVRDAAGEPITNEAVVVIFRIGQSGSTIYQESHNVNTNQFGLVNLVIGEGIPSTGVFGNIKWNLAPVSLTVIIDNNVIDTQTFKSVPYAFSAQSAQSIQGRAIDMTSPVNGTVLTYDGVNDQFILAQGGASNWATSGVNNIYRETGNVGIGAVPANYKLDVRSTANSLVNTSSSGAPGGTIAGVRFAMSSGAIGTQYYVVAEKTDNIVAGTSSDFVMRKDFSTAGGLLKFFRYDNSTNNVIINDSKTTATAFGDFIVANGNVGIGTITPVNKLDVEGGVAIGATYSGTSVAPTNGLIVEGRVGIGAVAPLYPLHIQTASNTPFTINMTSNGAFSASTGYNRIRMENGTSTQHWLLSSHAQIGAESTNNANFNIFYSGLGNIASFRGDGSVGIGIDVPTTGTRLHVQSNASTGYVARFYNTNTDVGSDGIVIGVGGSTPSTGANYILFTRAGASSFPTGSITSTGANGVAYNATSDRRLKQNIVDIENALGVINKMQPRTYQFKVNPSMSQDGFIAQEMAEVYPWVVSGNPDGDVLTDPMMIDYSKLTPILTKAIQEQQQLIEENQKQIQLLQEELNALKRQ